MASKNNICNIGKRIILGSAFRNEKTMDDKPKFFDDDGTEINPNLFPKPQLCLSCKKNDNPNEEIICSLTRLDQRDEPEFKCFAYENLDNTKWEK